MIPIYVVAVDRRDFEDWRHDHGFHEANIDTLRPIFRAEQVRGHQFFEGQVQITDRAIHVKRDLPDIIHEVRHATRISFDDAVRDLKRREMRRRPSCQNDHGRECCFVHKTHATPHVGCPLR